MQRGIRRAAVPGYKRRFVSLALTLWLVLIGLDCSQLCSWAQHRPGPAVQAALDSLNQGATGAGLHRLRRIAVNDSDYFDSRYFLAQSYHALGRYDSAKILVDRLLTANAPGRHEHLILKSRILDDRGDRPASIRLLTRAQNEYPLSYPLRYELGLRYADAGQFGRAETAFHRALRRYPFDYYSHLALGQLYQAQGRTLPALAALATALLLEPHRAENRQVLRLLEDLCRPLQSPGPKTKPPNDSILQALRDTLRQHQPRLTYPRQARPLRVLEILLASPQHWLPRQATFVDSAYYKLFRQAASQGYGAALLNTLYQSQHQAAVQYLERHPGATDGLLDLIAQHFQNHFMQYPLPGYDDELAGPLWYNGNGQLRSWGTLYGSHPFGPWVHYYKNWARRAAGNFNKYGQRVGSWRYYYRNGQLKRTETYHYGRLDDTLREFYQNGALAAELNFHQGEQQGPAHYYYPTGQLKVASQWAAGRRAGAYRRYHPNGALLEASRFEAGQRQGLQRFYYPNGDTDLTLHYQQGLPHGPFRAYHPHGPLQERGSFSQGYQDSIWTVYDRHGGRKAQRAYQQGEREGPTAFYYPDGSLKRRAHFQQDYQHGETREFAPNGELTGLMRYSEGAMISYQFFDSSGNKLAAGADRNGTMRFERRNRAGTLLEQGRLRGGARVGTWKSYYINGALKAIMRMDSGRLHGTVQRFYPNGERRANVSYRHGRRAGTAEFFHPNGRLRAVEHYQNDSLWGRRRSYYPDGTLRAREYYRQDTLYGLQRRYGVGGRLRRRERLADTATIRAFRQPGAELRWDTLRIAAGRQRFRRYFPSGQVYQESWFDGGLRDSVWRYYRPGGQLAGRRRYEAGWQTGAITDYYPSGEVRLAGYFEADRRDSVWHWRLPSGTPWRLGRYAHGDRHGSWLRFSPDNRVIEKTRYYKDQKHGARIFQVSNNGARQAKLVYQFGRLVQACSRTDSGTWQCEEVTARARQLKLRYPDGQLALRASLLAGGLHGSFARFYPDGTLMETGHYVFGRRWGPFHFYDPKGCRSLSISYWDGQRHGPTHYYYRDGPLHRSVPFRFGRQHGEGQTYGPNGLLQRRSRYDNDVLYDVEAARPAEGDASP